MNFLLQIHGFKYCSSHRTGQVSTSAVLFSFVLSEDWSPLDVSSPFLVRSIRGLVTSGRQQSFSRSFYPRTGHLWTSAVPFSLMEESMESVSFHSVPFMVQLKFCQANGNKSIQVVNSILATRETCSMRLSFY